MNNDVQTIIFEMLYDLKGVRPDERKWAEKAIRDVYNAYARWANNGGIDIFNRNWGLLHPELKDKRMDEAELEKYNKMLCQFMRPLARKASLIYGVSKDRKRIVELPEDALSTLEFTDKTLATAIMHGVVKDTDLVTRFLRKG